MRTRSRSALLAPALALLLAALAPGLLGAAAPALAAVKQSGTTSLTAPIIQPGTSPTDSSLAKLGGQVTFKPAMAGRSVTIQRQTPGGAWLAVGKANENAAGTVSFTGAPSTSSGAAYSYRGVAAAYKGVPAFTSAAQSAAHWVPTFTEQFSGTALPSTWKDRPSGSPSRTCAATGDPRARSVSGGTLQLRVMLDPGKTGQVCHAPSGNFKYYLNGSVKPIGFSQTYGTFAARIKLQQNRGQHGAFWMQPLAPRHIVGDPAASGAEIDIEEFFGKGYDQGGLFSNVYNYSNLDPSGRPVKIGGRSNKATSLLPKGDTWWTSYHVFSVEWTSKEYIFRVDGREHFRTPLGVSGIPEYPILSALTSDWELKQAKQLGITPGATVSVDWVRAWK